MTDPAGKEESARPSFAEAFSAAARRSGIGQVAPGQVPTAKALLRAIGGIRGLVESVLPGLAFLVVYSITQLLLPSVLIPLALSIVFVLYRVITRTPLNQAFAGVAGIAISAVLAILSGRAVDNFIPGLVINAVSLAVILISLAVRWPVIGIIVGFLTNEPTAWREQKGKRRVLTLVTWLWAGLFAVRLFAEYPLFLAGETEALAAVKLILGVPLYATMLWVSWLLVQAVYGRHHPVASAAPQEDDRHSNN